MTFSFWFYYDIFALARQCLSPPASNSACRERVERLEPDPSILPGALGTCSIPA